MAIQEHHIVKYKTTILPVIYPLVLYTGKKPYKLSMDVFDLYEDQKELAKQIMTSPYHLIDLSQASPEEFEKYKMFGTMARFAKHIHDPDILPFLKRILSTLKEIESLGEEKYIFITLSYVVEAGKIKNEQGFIEAVTKELESIDEDKIMTLAEHFRQEARKEIVLSMVQRDFSIETIAEITKLPESEIQELKEAIT